jgi:tetratricopeptide (TPR) repeat protein
MLTAGLLLRIVLKLNEILIVNIRGYKMKFEKYVFAVVISLLFAFGDLFAQDYLQMGIDKLTKKDYNGAIENFQKAVEKTPKLSNAYFYLAEAYFLTGHLDNSEVNLKKAVEYDDENAKALKRLGDVLFQKGLFRDALNQYTLAIKLEKRNSDFLLAQGKALVEIDSIDKAVNVLSLAIEISPKNPELYIARGNAYLKMGVAPMAIDNLKKASDLDSNNAEAHIRLGDIYMSGKLKMYREAINEYIRAVEIDSTNERILGKVSHILYYNASSNPVFYSRAANYYRQYIKLCDTSYQAFVEYGSSLLKIKQFDLSIEMLKKSLKLRKKPIEGYRSLAMVNYLKNTTENFKESSKSYEELEKIDSLSAEEYARWGRLYVSLKDTSRAVKTFEKALKVDPAFDVFGELANLYLKGKNYSEAAKYLKMKVATDTTEARYKTWISIGGCLFAAKDNDGARESYLTAISINPNDVKAHYWAALVYTTYGKNDSSKLVNEHLKKVIELAEGREDDFKDELAFANSNIAFSDYTAKNYQKALDGFNRALKYDSKNINSMFFIAGCYAGLGQKEDACKACDRLLKVNPKHKDALELKKKLGCWVFE